MGFSKLILPDNKRYYKNPGSIIRLINYILASDKTYYKKGHFEPKVRYFDSNCVDISSPHNAARQIKAVKKFFNKTDGRQMYHYILSFDEAVKDPKKLYKIGLEIMDEFFDGYQTIFAVHEDTDNLHIHFVFNSVSYVTGKKWCPKHKEFYHFKKNIECKADSHFHTIMELIR